MLKLLLLPEQLSTSIFTWSPISSPEIRSGRRGRCDHTGSCRSTHLDAGWNETAGY